MSRRPAPSDLATYQSALLDLFARDDLDLAGRLERLRGESAFAPFAEHVAAFDPAFVEQCTTMTKRWATRTRRRPAFSGPPPSGRAPTSGR